MLQLTTPNKNRLALEPAHISAIEELPMPAGGWQDELTPRTRLHIMSGCVNVIEEFEHVFNEWASESGDYEDEYAAAINTINAAQARVRSLELPTGIANTDKNREIFTAFKGAVIEALATI